MVVMNKCENQKSEGFAAAYDPGIQRLLLCSLYNEDKRHLWEAKE